MAVRFVVTGMVQGVGFRAFARRTALRLGLSGYAMNLWDGRVEAVVDGSREGIDTFEVALRKGPSMSLVKNVTREDVSDEPDLPKDFDIK